MKAIIKGNMTQGFILHRVVSNNVAEKIDFSRKNGQIDAQCVDIVDPSMLIKGSKSVSKSEHFVAYGRAFEGATLYGPFSSQESAEEFVEEAEDDTTDCLYVPLYNMDDPELDRMIDAAKKGFNPMQKHLLKIYDDGDFSVLNRQEEIQRCGDMLLRFLMAELSEIEKCMTFKDACIRIEQAKVMLDDVLTEMTAAHEAQ